MITIISNFTANKYYPSSNQINTTVESSNSGNCNMRFICDLYIGGVKVFTDKVFPDPTTGYGFFQLNRVIQDYIKTTLPYTPPANLFSYATETTTPSSVLSVYCKFGEEYDSSANCDGTVLQHPNLATSNTFYAFEAAIDYEDYLSFVYTDYIPSTTTSKFLTNSPRTIEVTFNDSYYLDFLLNTAISASYSLVVDCGSTSSTIGCGLTADRKRFRVGVGPYDINEELNTPFINLGITSYQVYLTYNSSQVSEKFTFKVSKPKAFQTRIGFIGLKGSIENFTFYHRNIKSFDISRKTFEKYLQSNHSGSWTYQVGDRGTTTYKVSAQEKHAVSTYCEKSVALWLYEMWLSPEVWVYDRPESYEVNSYKSGSNMYLYMADTSKLNVGDYVMFIPCTTYSAYTGRYQITSITGNQIDIGLTYTSFTAMDGYLYVDKDWRRLPIIISDNTIEVKQKTAKPVEYALAYSTAYQKTTLR